MDTASFTQSPRDPEVTLDETRLVARAQAGETMAYDGLVRAHYRRIYAAAFHLVGNPEDAEDLAQDCFVKGYRALRWFRQEGSLHAWLRRILVHLARDRFRAAARLPARSPLPAEISAKAHLGPQAELGRVELGRLVCDAIAGLPDNLRLALVLRALEGWSYDEVADATGVTPETARTQVMRARRALQRRLGRYLEES